MIVRNKTLRISLSCICILGLLACMSACAPARRQPVEPLLPPTAPTEPTAPLPEPPEPADPRHGASLQLSDQGRILLQQKRYDDAIRTLERAISLYPQNGISYYYMAEAWLFKGNFGEALKFNGLAESCLEESSQWSLQGKEQRKRIKQLEN